MQIDTNLNTYDHVLNGRLISVACLRVFVSSFKQLGYIAEAFFSGSILEAKALELSRKI